MPHPAAFAEGPQVTHSPLTPPLPGPGQRIQWGRLYGASPALALAAAANQHPGLLVAVVEDVQAAARLAGELAFFLGQGPDGGRETELPVLGFPDWETLPYDVFSPLPELVSERLLTLHRLPDLTGGRPRGILVVPVSTMLQRLPPRDYVDGHSLVLGVGERLDLDQTRRRLERAGYQCVSQVIAHGEFAVRGSLLDVFPMGSREPYRIDLFDDEVESIRTFDPDTQRTREKVPRIHLLPAREFPLSDEAVSAFRQRYRAQIEGDPKRSLIYREVSEGRAPGGLEYYLPLFFEATATLFDYLPAGALVAETHGVREAAAGFLATVAGRYEQRRHDIERPLLPPRQLYLEADELTSALKGLPGVLYQSAELPERHKGFARACNFATRTLPPLAIQARATEPAAALKQFVGEPGRRVLFLAESTGRREVLADHLRGFGLRPKALDGWRAFLDSDVPLGLTVAPLEQGLLLNDEDLALVTETQLYGERVRQERRRRARERDGEAVVRNLTELLPGAPVVHEAHGVGRFLGLQTLTIGGVQTELVALEYARGDKLYVPVSSLHLISRYTGASPEAAPLHRLGGDQWDKLKRKAAEKVRDVAAELLEVYARRAARQGVACPAAGDEYAAFAAAFA
ncbi:MAG TPA: CarD family transcriptional regulator, partial [Chromatiaceae bacterium]|nr:CarD family transcriptional regulator [Chromatiaceae bacterium]